jgi:hypothetical protein
MNMISTGAFQSEMDSSLKQPTIAEKFAALWEKKNAKAARAGGLSLMALSLAACGSDTTTTTTASTSTTTTTTTTTVTPVAKALTTAVDAETGTTAADTYSAEMSATATLNTAGLLDTVDGGAGSDTFTLVNTTANGAGTQLPTLTNVENFVYMASGGGNLDFDDAGSATNFTIKKVFSTSDFSDVALTDTVTLEDVQSTFDSTFTYKATGVTGAADSATVTINGAEAGADIVFVGAVETMNFTASAASSFADFELAATTTAVNLTATTAFTVATTLTNAGVTTWTVTGAGKVDMNGAAGAALGAAVVTYDASAATGAQEIIVGATNTTVTTGTGADVVDMQGNLTVADTIDLGAGDDTLRVDIDGLSASASDLSVSNVETLRFDNTAGNAGAIQMDNLAVTTLRFDAAATASAGALTLTDLKTDVLAMSYIGAGTADADNFFNEVIYDYDTTTTANTAVITVNNGGVVGDDMRMDVVDMDRIEKITINATDIGQAAADEFTIDEIEADHVTDVVVSSDGEYLVSLITTAALDTLDFSGADKGGQITDIADAAAAITITMGDGGDTVIFSENTALQSTTIDLGAGADAYTSTDRTDTITTGTGSDTITLQGDASDDANVIKDFTAGVGGDVIDFGTNGALGQGTATLTEYAEYATVAAWATATAADTGDEGAGGFVVIGANVTAGTEAALVATIGGALVVADTATTSTAGAQTDIIYVAADNGTDTFIFHFVNDGASSALDSGSILAADTTTLIATLEGVSDATALHVNNFADFLA